MKQEDDLFDLVVETLKKRGGKIKGIQPCEPQGERIIIIDYYRAQSRISIIINQNYISIRCSFNSSFFVQTFESIIDNEMTNEHREELFNILLDTALKDLDATNEEILFTIN